MFIDRSHVLGAEELLREGYPEITRVGESKHLEVGSGDAQLGNRDVPFTLVFEEGLSKVYRFLAVDGFVGVVVEREIDKLGHGGW